ncbi:MAG: hypothetical protein JSW17_00520 [Candidatus Omnitrophota bacterium]|nr:MAG: hypothetical protein JSW17_00520 [Candidatus Omnitrophota bacterium]
MISRIKGNLIKKDDNRVLVDVGGIFYEVNIPRTVAGRICEDEGSPLELIIYHYLHMDKSKGVPVLIGFIDELEKDFFERFISVSGIGPKAALRAFDKPVSSIAQAIEEGNINFLKTLAGIGQQKAKHIVAALQGKVGRFALLKGEECNYEPAKKEITQEAKQILKRLQYSAKEIEEMITKALKTKPEAESTEDLLNEIYRQRK